MFFSGKKIVYLNCYKEDVKGASAGFAKFLEKGRESFIELSVRRLSWPDGDYQVILEGEKENFKLGTVFLKNGEARGAFGILLKDGYVNCGKAGLSVGDICRIAVLGNCKERLEGRFKEIICIQETPKEEIKEEVKMGTRAVSETEARTEENTPVLVSAQKNTSGHMQEYSGDKWTQLQSAYQQIRPFGDERTFISIEPKDFIILQAPYQKLVNNSFLLHGFYNYRHMILGTCSGLGGEEETFYLGVPGTYHEREKMVAVMFGFEGFECNGSVENGKFGYYMRRVEI